MGFTGQTDANSVPETQGKINQGFQSIYGWLLLLRNWCSSCVLGEVTLKDMRHRHVSEHLWSCSQQLGSLSSTTVLKAQFSNFGLTLSSGNLSPTCLAKTRISSSPKREVKLTWMASN